MSRPIVTDNLFVLLKNFEVKCITKKTHCLKIIVNYALHLITPGIYYFCVDV
jgi:hypothetical protein